MSRNRFDTLARMVENKVPRKQLLRYIEGARKRVNKYTGDAKPKDIEPSAWALQQFPLDLQRDIMCAIDAIGDIMGVSVRSVRRDRRTVSARRVFYALCTLHWDMTIKQVAEVLDMARAGIAESFEKIDQGHLAMAREVMRMIETDDAGQAI